jgi:hypothetical protein
VLSRARSEDVRWSRALNLSISMCPGLLANILGLLGASGLGARMPMDVNPPEFFISSSCSKTFFFFFFVK